MENKKLFDPTRVTKGKCSYCQWPIEMYDEVRYCTIDIFHEAAMHVECAQQAVYDIEHLKKD